MKNSEDTKYIIEFLSLGGSVKVSAIDQASGTEVSIIGPPKATQKELSDLAIKKLQYVLNKNKKNQ